MAFLALKAIGKTDTELRVRNHIVLFNSRDLEFLRKGANLDGSMGEYFDPAVDLESPATKTGKFPVDFEHRQGEFGKDVLGFVDWSTAKKDDEGWMVDRILDRRKKYVQMLEPLIEAGLIGTSSEPFQNMTKYKSDGGIIQWGLMRDTLTVNPAEPKMLGENAITALKNVSEFMPAAKSLLDAIENKQTGTQSGGDKDGTKQKVTVVQRRKVTVQTKPIVRKTMDILQAIKELLPDLNDEQLKKLAAILGLTDTAVASTADEQIVDPEGNEIKTIVMGDLVKSLTNMGYPVQLPGMKKKKAITRPIFESNPAAGQQDAGEPGTEEDPEVVANRKSIEAAYFTRYHDEPEAKKAIMTDLVGKSYPLILHDQQKAFAKYIRHGENALDRSEHKSLKTIYFPAEKSINLILNEGWEVKAIKDAQVEAIGQLGGFAVPPMGQAGLESRLIGNTGVRGGGANVIELINTNSTEVDIYKGNSDSYMGEMRGQWGNETADPEEQGFEVEEETVVAEIYTFKVKLSQSQAEDQANLLSKVYEEIYKAVEIDEDFVFATGNGARKPHGILPNGKNANGIAVVASGHASELTYDGIRRMKRKVPPQYRKNATWLGNSDTFGDIELIKFSGSGEPAFPDLTEEDVLLKRRIFECEAMPDVAANTFPLVLGDMSGYTIVERLGLSVVRFQDSKTGINKLEIHVRKRVGGRLTLPYLFRVQQVKA